MKKCKEKKIYTNLVTDFVNVARLNNMLLLILVAITIICVCVKQSAVVYWGIGIAYGALAALCATLILAVFLCNRKRYISINGQTLFVSDPKGNCEIEISKIEKAIYYPVKWYMVMTGITVRDDYGTMYIWFDGGHKKKFDIFYKDYLKLADKFKIEVE